MGMLGVGRVCCTLQHDSPVALIITLQSWGQGFMDIVENSFRNSLKISSKL